MPAAPASPCRTRRRAPGRTRAPPGSSASAAPPAVVLVQAASEWPTSMQVSAELFALIEAVYQRQLGLHPQLFAMFQTQESFLQTPTVAHLPFKQSEKHFPQCLSIVRNLQLVGVLPNAAGPSDIVLEAGSGTGELGLTAALCLTSSENSALYHAELASINSTPLQKKNTIPSEFRSAEKSTMFLVDLKQGLKYKNDRYFCFTDFRCVRLNGDLLKLDTRALQHLSTSLGPGNQNLDVPTSLPQSQETAAPRVTVIGKHLCGAATDAVLRYEARAFGIALCCHAKSDGAIYLNPEYFASLAFPVDIAAAHKLTAYQHCYGTQELSEAQKRNERAGIMCRQMLDVGRLLALQRRGYACGVLRYCSRELTGEYYLLWAKK